MSTTAKISVTVITAGIAATAGFLAVLSTGADWRAYTVQGGSMEPQYEQGDLIITSTAGAEDVQPGEIIVFKADWASNKYDQRVVHRVAAVGTIQGLPIAYTRGDANAIADPRPVDLTGDVRVVKFSIPAGGLWLRLLLGPVIVAVLATLAAGMTAAAFFSGVPVFSDGLRHMRMPRRRPVEETVPLTDLRDHQFPATQLPRPPVLPPALPVRRMR